MRQCGPTGRGSKRKGYVTDRARVTPKGSDYTPPRAGFLFAASGLQSRFLLHDIFQLVPVKQGGLTGARAVRAPADVVRQIQGCLGIAEHLSPPVTGFTNAKL